MKRWLKRTAIVSALAIALVVTFGAGYAVYAIRVSEAPQTQTPTREQLLSLVNAERIKHGAAPLKEDTRLDESAQFKASDMAQRNYYSHFDPVTGQDSHDIIFATGIQCIDSSENLDENTSAPTAVAAWIASAPHHMAMTDPKYSLTGFGFAKDQRGYYYFVEHFCQVP